MPTVKKEAKVEELAEKVQNAKIMILTDTRGLTVSQIQGIRTDLRKLNAEFNVAKNTLTKLAVKKGGAGATLDLDAIFAGPTTVAFAYGDETSPAKVLKKFASDIESFDIKGAIFQGTFLTREQVEELATLPSKEALLGKLVGMLNSPLYGLLNVAQAKQRELLYALKAVAATKTS
ncbi:MAG: 50S ribosomal protein L10 [bacterium]